MDIISFNEASTANGRIESFIENPDSTSGIVTVPKVIASGETITIPEGRVAVLPNVQVDGTLNIEGEVFIPSGATFSKVVETEGNQTIDGIKTFVKSPIVPQPPQFDSSTNIATTSFVQRALGNFKSSHNYIVSTTLSNLEVGGTVVVGGNITITLPSFSTGIPVGATYKILCGGASGVIIKANGTDSLYAIGNGMPRTFTLQSGDELTVSNVGGVWYAWGSAQLGFSTGMFGSSLSGNGYQKLPGGLIIQWGTKQINNTAINTLFRTNVIFPISFPNAPFSVLSTPSNAGYAYLNVSSESATTTGYAIVSSTGQAGLINVSFIAIGY